MKCEVCGRKYSELKGNHKCPPTTIQRIDNEHRKAAMKDYPDEPVRDFETRLTEGFEMMESDDV